MEFIMDFIEVITMILLLGVIIFGFLYAMRHRERIGHWVNNFDKNTIEKEEEITRLKRRIEDSQKAIEKLEKTETED